MEKGSEVLKREEVNAHIHGRGITLLKEGGGVQR